MDFNIDFHSVTAYYRSLFFRDILVRLLICFFLLLLIKDTRIPGLQNCTHRCFLNEAIHTLGHWMLEFCLDQIFLELLVLKLKRMFRLQAALGSKVSLLGVDSLWGDCTFIPADWGS